jgi:glycosyltransferase involved in cell wall biosynthesis
MNICMIAYTEYRFDPRVRREAEALAERGDKVDFICLSDSVKKDNKWEMISGVSLWKLKCRKYQGNNIIRYLLSYLDFFLKAAFRVAIENYRKRYKVIQVHTMPDFMVFCALIPKVFGAKIIIDIHDLMPELFMSKFNSSKKNVIIRLVTFVERQSVKYAHRAIAVHHPHLDALIGHGNPKEKFSILLNTPDQKIFNRKHKSLLRDDGVYRLIYHGTVSKRHGLDIAIRAVTLSRKNIPNITFDIIGDGDDIHRLVDLVGELSAQEFIYLSKKMIPMDELCRKICNSDLGIIPILNDSFTQYMLPTKLMEYVALGVPAITTRTKTIEAYFDDSMVQFFQAGSVDSLSHCINDLFINSAKRAAMVKNANKFNEKYNWNVQKKNYYELIDSLTIK